MKNNGKYLSRSYEKEQNECYLDKDHYTTDKQTFYGLPANEGHREDLYSSFTIKSPSKKEVDLRKRSECGD
jgi:hypothetical protein